MTVAGLLTYFLPENISGNNVSGLPAPLKEQWQGRNNIKRSLQQRGLLRIFTGFPIMPDDESSIAPQHAANIKEDFLKK